MLEPAALSIINWPFFMSSCPIHPSVCFPQQPVYLPVSSSVTINEQGLVFFTMIRGSMTPVNADEIRPGDLHADTDESTTRGTLGAQDIAHLSPGTKLPEAPTDGPELPVACGGGAVNLRPRKRRSLRAAAEQDAPAAVSKEEPKKRTARSSR